MELGLWSKPNVLRGRDRGEQLLAQVTALGSHVSLTPPPPGGLSCAF